MLSNPNQILQAPNNQREFEVFLFFKIRHIQRICMRCVSQKLIIPETYEHTKNIGVNPIHSIVNQYSRHCEYIHAESSSHEQHHLCSDSC